MCQIRPHPLFWAPLEYFLPFKNKIINSTVSALRQSEDDHVKDYLLVNNSVKLWIQFFTAGMFATLE